MAEVQHMVVMKFKQGTSQDDIDGIYRMLAALPSQIPGIKYYGGGPYSSPEGFNQGYTHGFLITFESEAARDAYLPHPDHAPVRDAIIAVAEGVVAFDFTA